MLIITTGGTIEGLDYTDESAKITSKTISIKELISKFRIDFRYSIRHLFSKDSRCITKTDRELIVKTIKCKETKNILITHGTYTMIETAEYLAKLNINKTIILTGSFILGTKENSDASSNLKFAISQFKVLKEGVYIVIQNRVFTWDNVRKNVERNQFESKLD
ncbi:asparaginase [Tenacibaculum adriaticum]|uniref:Asparaginase n=1 Tax=Tenacibaculum adriaticum TaxID=413713 RepID=A0A5S5DWU8_9FLAO|nr:asparaginase domain-containing protein [Tenacibaculum adriaticum]TYQ00205.1 asparaginase [Tenacibaculum adriaticum]